MKKLIVVDSKGRPLKSKNSYIIKENETVEEAVSRFFDDADWADSINDNDYFFEWGDIDVNEENGFSKASRPFTQVSKHLYKIKVIEE